MHVQLPFNCAVGHDTPLHAVDLVWSSSPPMHDKQDAYNLKVRQTVILQIAASERGVHMDNVAHSDTRVDFNKLFIS